jgi:hypothetical protein
MTSCRVRTRTFNMPRKHGKPLKYPKKLRVTLEQVADGAKERQAEANLTDELVDKLSSFWRSFLPPNSVAFLQAKTDDLLMRMETTSYMRPRLKPTYRHVPPPWKQ